MSQLVRILQDFWPDNSGMLSAYYRNPGRIIQESWPSVTGTLAGCYKNNQIDQFIIQVEISTFFVGLFGELPLSTL